MHILHPRLYYCLDTTNGAPATGREDMTTILALSGDSSVLTHLVGSYREAMPELQVETVTTCDAARERLSAEDVALLICDWSGEPELDDMLNELDEVDPFLPTLLLADEGNLQEVHSRLDRDNRDYLLKHPLLLPDLPHIAQRHLDFCLSRQQLQTAEAELYDLRGDDPDSAYRPQRVFLRREAILQAVTRASQKLLQPSSTIDDIMEVLELLGEAAEVSRGYIFQNHVNASGELVTSQLYEWAADNVSPELANQDLQELAYVPDYERWQELLGDQQVLHGPVREMPAHERPLLEEQGVQSLLVAPIFVGETWWGFFGFDDCWSERQWASLEIDALQTAARLLGAALQRQQWESKLTQMNECFLRFGPDPLTNIDLVTTLCGKLFEATSAFYNRLDEGMLCRWGAFGTDDPVLETPAAGHICMEVIDQGDELYLPNLQETPYAESDSGVREFGLQTYYGRAVKFKGQSIGALGAVFQHSFQPTDDDRKLMAIMASAIGVEEDRRSAETELRQLAITVEQATESIAVLDTQGHVEYVNPAFEETSGYSREELVGQELPLFRNALQDQEFYREIWRTLRKGDVWSNRIVNRRRDGTVYHEDVVFSPIRDVQGRVTHFVAVKRDITKELELEEQLRHSQKMESVGRLAGGVAHDFNNLLSVIMGYADMTLSHLPDDHSLYDMVMEIRKAGERATALTQQLLAFSRKQVLEVKSINLNTVIDDMRNMLSRLIGEHITFETELDPAIYNIRADVIQLQQILMNLVLNARDAIDDTGTVVIETSNDQLTEDDPRRSAELEPGDYVVLSVIDNGHGIDKETQHRIFDPFYTTKSRGKGTGLGLATVHGIVKQHQGDIIVHSQVGEGTEFQIFFPSEQAGKKIGDTTIVDEVEVHGTETVLLVEDDFNVLSLAKRVLEKYGYQVLPADGPEVAMRRIDQYGDKIHLLLTDVVMPRMNGPELYHHLRPHYPDLKVLYMSGYTEASLRNRGIIGPDDMIIGKPFTLSALTEGVRLTLDAHPDT